MSGAGEGVGVAQCVREPERAGHPADQAGGLVQRHPGSGDEQRPGRSAAQDLHRVGGGAEPRLSHADDRDAEGRVGVRSQAGAASRIKVRIAVDEEQAKLGQAGEHGPQWRQFAEEELAGPVRQHLGEQNRPLGQYGGEGRIGGEHGGCPRAAGGQIVHICRGEYFRACIVCPHPARMTRWHR